MISTSNSISTPIKLVKNENMMHAYENLMRLINGINNSVLSKSYNDIILKSSVSHNIDLLLNALDELKNLIEKHPPLVTAQRFGNKSYRNWYADMNKEVPNLISKILSNETQKSYLPTLNIYFSNSFGDVTRIDYGTGHETNLFFFISCLLSIGVIGNGELGDVMACFFRKYLELVRLLQKTYKMEPAGSHGVWGLDDFQFLPFLFGSSQLINSRTIEPSMYIDEVFVSKNKDGWMFLEAIDNINQTKSGPFFEHSNYLYNISATPDWKKVNKGLMIMYQKEIQKGDCPLESDIDLVRTNLSPNDHYKSMILAGQSPDVIMEIASRAVSFWDYQCYQEKIYQTIVVNKSKDSKSKLEAHYANLTSNLKAEIETNLEKSTQNNQLQKQLNDINEKYNDKYRQVQRIQSLYDTLKKKTVSLPSIKRLSEYQLSTNNNLNTPVESTKSHSTTENIKNSTMISTNLCTADDFFNKKEPISASISPRIPSANNNYNHQNKENIVNSTDSYTHPKHWVNLKSKQNINKIKTTGSLMINPRRQKTPLFDLKNMDLRKYT